MKYILLSFICSLVSLSLLYSTETTQEFAQEWRAFLSQKEINLSMIGKEEHFSKEHALIEEFGTLQFPRRRPSIKGMDRDERWVPYRDNKVTLSNGTEMSASPVHLKDNYHHFIASQAPYKHNIHLFWQMIWENQANQIVQVTELTEEPNRELSVPYWPEKIGATLTLETGLTITLADERSLLTELHEKIEIRTLHIQNKGEKRIVTHYWYRNWPDHTAPSQTRTLATLIETVNRDKLQSGSTAPIVVHCHGGVGRTGVFITSYHLTQRSQKGELPHNLFEFAASLRWQRPRLLSNPLHYAFCSRYLENLKANQALKFAQAAL